MPLVHLVKEVGKDHSCVPSEHLDNFKLRFYYQVLYKFQWPWDTSRYEI